MSFTIKVISGIILIKRVRKENVMVFKSDNCINKDGSFYLDENVSAVEHKSVCKAEILEFFYCCAFTLCKVSATKSEELIFKIGNNDGIEVGD